MQSDAREAPQSEFQCQCLQWTMGQAYLEPQVEPRPLQQDVHAARRASALDGRCVRESEALASALPEDALAKTHEVVSRDFGDAVMDVVVCSAKGPSKWC